MRSIFPRNHPGDDQFLPKAGRQDWRPRVRRATVFLFAEFSGTTVAIFLGICANISSTVAIEQHQSLSIFGLTCWAWGLAFMAGSSLTARISGAHLNPALSIAFAVVRGLGPLDCLMYIVGQMSGGFVGSGLAYLIYRESIVEAGLDGPTIAKAICAGPNSAFAPSSAFMTEYTATTLLMILICALAAGSTSFPGSDISSVKVGLTNTLIMMALGYQTGPVLNPARDTGPRLVALWIGADGVFRGGFWWYGAWLATISGAISGVLIHDKLLRRDSTEVGRPELENGVSEVISEDLSVCCPAYVHSNGGSTKLKNCDRPPKHRSRPVLWPRSVV